jgi:uncharacterized membrane protein YbhN (UPF0104 family)
MRALALRAAVIAGLLALLATQIDFDQTVDSLREVQPAYVVAVLLLNLPIAVLFGVRQHLVLRSLDLQLPPRIVYPAAVLGNVAGALTPAASGDLLRAAVLRSHAELPVDDGLALVAYERGLSLYALVVGTLGATAWLFVPQPWGILLAAASLVLVALPLAGSRMLRLLPRVGDDAGNTFRRALYRAESVAGRLGELLDDRQLLLPWFLLTTTILAIATAQYWLLARSMSDAVTPLEAWFAFGASQLLAIVSLLPFGLGIADTSLAAFLRRAGMTLEQGTAVAILVRITSTLPLTLLAVACYLYLLHVGRSDDGSAATREPLQSS